MNTKRLASLLLLLAVLLSQAAWAEGTEADYAVEAPAELSEMDLFSPDIYAGEIGVDAQPSAPEAGTVTEQPAAEQPVAQQPVVE